MKRPNKLLNDLAEDSVSPEFRATLMNQTLRAARRRKHARQFTAMASAIALMGAIAILFQIRIRENGPTERPKTIAVTPLNDVQVTKPDSTNPVTVVQTDESDRPREINDKELLALAGDMPVALIPRGPDKSELVFLSAPGN